MAIPMQEFITQLPVLFQYVQIFSYVVLALFFGAAAMKGWKGFLPWYFRWSGRIGTGFVCLIFGIAIGDYIPTLSTGIFRLFQSQTIAGGLVGGIIFSVALYLISSRSPKVIESYKKEIERLTKKISKMKDVKPNKVLTAVGVAIIAVLLVLTALNFRGFPPSIADDLFSSFLPEGGLPGGVTMGPGMAQMDPDCLSAITSMSTIQEEQPELLRNLTAYSNPALKSSIEQSANASVVEMVYFNYQGKKIVLALLSDDRSCIATESLFCACGEGAEQ